ncbi:thiamine pyrophosphate-binding protein [Tsukamurella sp. 1534]|uniref:thiamine pyrophosphate-binding protein n=1 Tax=Tsukamurella sp. 1534 TaxID=1151061 RepID=UPI00059455FC|nr:thiamine pyrophosphate-binding protein [Tsukamurella sp. 1534]
MSTVWDRCAELLGSSRLFAGVAGDDPGLLDAAVLAGAPVLPCRDQRTAAFAAAGASMVSGAPAVLCTHSGPDLLNALVGVSEAYSAGVPMVVVTATLGHAEVGRGAFQHFPVQDLGPGLFHWVHRAVDEADLYWALGRADRLARAASGPVHVVVDGATGATGAAVAPPPQPEEQIPPAVAPETAAHIADTLADAERPVLVLGGGARGGDPDDLTRIADGTGAVVLTTASGRGVFPESHPRFAGLLGLYLAPESRTALEAADEILVVGSRLEETARMGWTPGPAARITQVDTDPRMIGRAHPATAVVADAPALVRAVARAVPGASPDRHTWDGLQPHSTHADERSSVALTAPAFFRVLGTRLADSDVEVLAQENGLADLWGYYAPVFRLPRGVRPLVPGEQTALGFGLGAGLGAAMTGRKVLAVGGDGAFGMNVATLSTAIENRATIAFVELIDGGFGWPSTTRACRDRLVDFRVPSGAAALAAATGTPVLHVTIAEELPDAIENILGETGPALLCVHLDARRTFPPPSTWPS